MRIVSLVLLLAACSDITADALPVPQAAPPGACGVGQSKVYRDVDVDNYYPANAASMCASSTAPAPSGYTRIPGDCNDNNASIHPNAPETQNGVDDDCDGQIDELPPRLQTITLDGQAIDDGLLVDLSAARDMRVAIWVDTTDVLTDTTADVDQSLSGEDHTATLQSCTASPTVACPQARGYVIVDDLATIVPDVREQTLTYEIVANDGTAFRHRVTVLESPRGGATAAMAETVSATALDRLMRAASDELTAEVDAVVQEALGDLEDISVSYDDLRIEMYGVEGSVTGDNTGEGTMDGKLVAQISLGDVHLEASCFTADLHDVAVVLKLSPRVPEYGASASGGGWPSRYANATFGSFTADWFDWNINYGNIQGQSPWDWAAGSGELAFVVHETLLTFDGQSVTVDEEYDVIRDSIEVVGESGCWLAEGTAETQVEDMLGDISYHLQSNGLISALRDETFGSPTFEEVADTVYSLAGYNLYEGIYGGLDLVLQTGWAGADNTNRGLPLDRLPAVRNVLEYFVNESLHGGLPLTGSDVMINLDGSLPLGEDWSLDLALDTSWFADTASGNAHTSLVWSTRLTGAPASDSGVRYTTWLAKGDALVANPAEGPNGAFASASVGETMINQALHAVVTSGMLNQDLGDGTTLETRVVPWADIGTDGELRLHLRGLDLESTATGGYAHLVADGDAVVQLHQADDEDLVALETALGFDDDTDILISAMGSLELDGDSLNVTALKGRDVPTALENLAAGWIEDALLEGLKLVACAAPDHFLPVGVDDPANYCAGDEVADTYWMYLLVPDALGTLSDGDFQERLPGHYTATRMSDGLTQWDLTVVKAFDPYLTITDDGVAIPSLSFDLTQTTTASQDIDTMVTRTFATGTDPSGVVWSDNKSWISVDSAGLVSVNPTQGDLGDDGMVTGTVTATWLDAQTGLTLTDTIIVYAHSTLPGDEDDGCFWTTYYYCP